LVRAACSILCVLIDKRRGLESLPPHGAIKFKPLVRTRRKKGRDVQVVSVSSVKVQSQSELDYLRNHSQYGIAFYENMESAMNVDSTWAQKMVEAQQSISKLSDMQIIARAKQEGVTINQSPEAMRRQLVELTAKRSINQQDRMLYGNLRKSTMDQQGRIVTEKTINS
jgi:Txe/YoeB family toxin of Txe-Axe toxin-antitoxin module